MSNCLRTLWAVCLVCLAHLPLHAQGEAPEAFTWLDAAPRPLPSLAAERFQEVAARFDLLRSAPPRLGLPLLGGVTVLAERTGFERRGDGYTWLGRIAETDGSVVLTIHGTALAGLIESPDGIYEIVPRGRGTSSLALLATDRFPREAESLLQEPQPGALAPASFSTASRPDPQGRIDVMVLYTPAARAAAGGTNNIRATAQLAVDAANTAYANSQITTRLRLVHTQEVAYDEDYFEYSDHLYWLSADPGVARLREAHRADLVDLLVEDGEYCGVAWVMSNVSPLFAGSGFSVTTRSCAAGNLSFAHELGHNMGSQHDPANGSVFASFPHSYGHFVSGVFRTVMSYNTHCTSNCPRVARFSNPNLTYGGHPLGIANARDNHRTINATDAVVANFRQQAPASDFYTVAPCRVVDTRGGAPLLSGVVRTLPVAGSCGVPADAVAVALNVTVADPTSLGSLRLYPADIPKPDATVINFLAGANRANAAILPLSTNGAGTLVAEPFLTSLGSVHLVLDVVGYFGLPMEDVWIPREPMPRGRAYAASAVIGGRIYVIGGQVDSSEMVGTVESFDPATGQWRTECPMPTPRALLSAAVVDGRIYAFGGQGTPGSPAELAVVEEFDPGALVCAAAWTTKKPMPTARSQAAAAVKDGKVYLLGGGATPRAVHEYNPGLDAWTVRGALPSATRGAAAVEVEGMIYLIGGLIGGPVGGGSEEGTESASGDVVAYVPAGGASPSRAPMLFPGSQHVAGVVDGRIYVVGGDSAVVQEYDPGTDAWEARAALPTLPKGAASGVVGGRLHVIGGLDPVTGFLDDNEAYLPPAVP